MISPHEAALTTIFTEFSNILSGKKRPKPGIPDLFPAATVEDIVKSWDARLRKPAYQFNPLNMEQILSKSAAIALLLQELDAPRQGDLFIEPAEKKTGSLIEGLSLKKRL